MFRTQLYEIQFYNAASVIQDHTSKLVILKLISFQNYQ